MNLLELFDYLLAFLEKGGTVLWILFGVSTLFWMLYFEKLLYYGTLFKGRSSRVKLGCKGLEASDSWVKQQKCIAALSLLREELFSHVSILRAIITLFPLLGLLGTISGMVSVFDAIALFSTDAKAMARGISIASITTMAGMILAVLGLLLYTLLMVTLKRAMEKLQRDIDA